VFSFSFSLDDRQFVNNFVCTLEILEDVTMGKCLREFGIELTDQIGFHPHTPEQMVRWTLKVRLPRSLFFASLLLFTYLSLILSLSRPIISLLFTL
jgi:hypothetical protein